MTWSLNEIDALSRKAARGAGYSWGLAEDAGRAVRWLEARKLPGATALAQHLQAVDGQDLAKLAPDPESWSALAGTACPILAGTMLADGLAGDRSEPLLLAKLGTPLLILPFLAVMAEAQGRMVGAEIAGARATLSPDGGLSVSAAVPLVASATVTLRFDATPEGPVVADGLRSACATETIAALNAFAHRTYAPATEESRLAGAGAGLTDND